MARLILVFAIAISCLAVSNRIDPGSIPVYSLPTKLLKAGVLSPREGVRLFRISQYDQVLLATLEPDTQVQYGMFPPGNYMVEMVNSGLLIPFQIFEPNQLLTVPDRVPANVKGWCWIPPGACRVGDELGIGAEDERPCRYVNVHGFWLASTEVTNQQYAEFLSAQKSVSRRWIDLESMKCRIQPGADGRYHSDRPDEPVVMVSLHGAKAYCDWLTRSTGIRHRLPTEWEWEKAARGPESHIYAYGNSYQRSAANQESGEVKPVGSFQPNSYGLFDMTGNVFEWMSNSFDPQSKVPAMNQSLRGGSFVLDGMYLRNSFRMRQSPGVMTDDIGFRVLREEN